MGLLDALTEAAKARSEARRANLRALDPGYEGSPSEPAPPPQNAAPAPPAPEAPAGGGIVGRVAGQADRVLNTLLGGRLMDPELLQALEANARQRAAMEERRTVAAEAEQAQIRKEARAAETRAAEQQRQRAGVESVMTQNAPALRELFPSMFQEQTVGVPEEGAMYAAPETRTTATVPPGAEGFMDDVVRNAMGRMAGEVLAQRVRAEADTQAIRKAGYHDEATFFAERQKIADTLRAHGLESEADLAEHATAPMLQSFAGKAMLAASNARRQMEQIRERAEQVRKGFVERMPVLYGYKTELLRLQKDLDAKARAEKLPTAAEVARLHGQKMDNFRQALQGARQELASLEQNLMLLPRAQRDEATARMTALRTQIADYERQMHDVIEPAYNETIKRLESREKAGAGVPIPDPTDKKIITGAQAEHLKRTLGWDDAKVRAYYRVKD